jgi:hypothetical protein
VSPWREVDCPVLAETGCVVTPIALDSDRRLVRHHRHRRDDPRRAAATDRIQSRGIVSKSIAKGVNIT